MEVLTSAGGGNKPRAKAVRIKSGKPLIDGGGHRRDAAGYRKGFLKVDSDPRERGFGRIVLVVDDNPAIRMVLATAFLSDGFKMCGEAENGTEAVTLAQQIKPDLITMDLSMPGISGLVASSALRKIFPKVPIILFTLFATKSLELEAAKVGISTVLSKATPLPTLIDKAYELMGV